MKKTILFLSILTASIACERTKTDTSISECGKDVVYVSQDTMEKLAVVEIIAKSCSTEGCHNSGATFGDFTTYESMLPYLENGEIKQQVLELNRMPTVGTPEADLFTEEDKMLIGCWLETNYEKN